MAGAEVLVELRASAGEFMAKMKEARGEVAKLEAESKGHMAKFSAVGKAALLGVAGAAVAVGAVSLEMADTFEKSHAKLEAAIKATGGSFEEYKTRIDATSKQMEKFGFTNADTEAALAQFTVSLKDPAKGLQEMGLAADLAKFKNIPLADSAMIVSKAMQGQLRPLKALGIDLPVAAGGAEQLVMAHRRLADATQQMTIFMKTHKDAVDASSKSHAAYVSKLQAVQNAQFAVGQATHSSTDILAALHQKMAGQASTAAETFAGKMLAVKAQAEDVSAKIGMALIPVIESLIGTVESVIGWFEKHRTTAEALGAVIAGVLTASIAIYVGGLVVAAATAVASFATMAAAALAWAAGMVVAGAIAMLPFLPLIAAVAAVGFAAYELYKHWNTVWSGITAVFSAVWNFIKQHAALIVGAIFLIAPPIAVLIAAVHLLYEHWSTVWGAIKAVTSAVAGAVTGAVMGLVHGGLWVIKKEVGLVQGVWNTVWGGIQSTVETVWSVLKPIFHAIASTVSTVTGAIGGLKGVVGGVGGAISGAGHLLGFADGTDYAPGGMAVVGERGPELVHLPRGSQVTPNSKLGSGVNVYITVQGSVTSEHDLAATVRDHLLQTSKRVGSLGLA